VMALDSQCAPVFSIEALRTLPIEASQLGALPQRTGHDGLYGLCWSEIDAASPNGRTLRLAVLGAGGELEGAGVEPERYTDLGALEAAVGDGAPAPALVRGSGAGLAGAGGELEGVVGEITERALELLKAWLSSERLVSSRLVLITEGALAAADGESPELSQAALPGLLRSARSEHPERFRLVDVDRSEPSRASLYGALISDEPELAIRQGSLYALRLARSPGGSLMLAAGERFARHAREPGAARKPARKRAAGGGAGARRGARGGTELPRIAGHARCCLFAG
jgi:hypothetical protein